MKKQYFQHIILYYFKEDKDTTEMPKKKKIVQLYGEGAVIDQMCQKWFVEFSDGDLAPQLG